MAEQRRTPADLRGAGRARQRVESLVQRALGVIRDDPRAALALARRAVRSAATLVPDDAALRAEAMLTRAHAHRLAGQHEAALADYDRAAEAFRLARQPVGVARTAAGALDSLRYLGRTDEALKRARAARRTFKAHGEAVRAAVLDMNLAGLYFHQDAYARALRVWGRARPVLAAAGRAEDVASLDNNAANALTQLDRLHQAEALYRASRAFYAARGTRAAVAGIDVNLGYLAYRQGRYGAAVDTLRTAAEAFDALGNVPLALVTRLDLVEAYLALNLLDEARALAAEQLRLALHQALPQYAARARLYQATVVGRLGLHEPALRELAVAEAEFAALKNTVWRTRCTIGRAAILVATGARDRLPEALALARQAARGFERLGLPSRQAGALLVQAQALLAVGEAAAAERVARAALALAERLGVPWLLFECQYAHGRALQALRNPGAAFAAHVAAAEALERVRAELRPEELRISLVSDKLDVYQHLVLLCLDRAAAGESDAEEEALQYAERAKSRVLAEQLAGGLDVPLDRASLAAEDARVLERMRQLRDELNWLYARLAESGDDQPPVRGSRIEPLVRGHRSTSGRRADVRQLRRRTAAREAELVRLQRRLEPAGHSVADRLGLGPGSTGDARSALAALRQQLPGDLAVLEYFQAGDELVCFSLAAEHLSAKRIGPVATAAGLVGRFDYQTRKFNLGAAYLEAHAVALQAGAEAVLRALCEAVLEPALAGLPPSVRRVVVVPHGVLHYVPFHAFIQPGGEPVMDTHEVSYAPSASALAWCLAQPGLPAAGPERPLVLGVADAALPHVADEVDALSRLLRAPRVLRDGQATTAAFLAHAPAADAIHLASHAVFREDNPLFSAVRLSDGWLSLYDLYACHLPARLVTLSGCETGVSQVRAGDELVGLSRGFFQAGAPCLVVSLWAVNDASTARLMEAFYRRLCAGQRPAHAMRGAQAELRRTCPHPYYWAPFLVVGRP